MKHACVGEPTARAARPVVDDQVSPAHLVDPTNPDVTALWTIPAPYIRGPHTLLDHHPMSAARRAVEGHRATAASNSTTCDPDEVTVDRVGNARHATSAKPKAFAERQCFRSQARRVLDTPHQGVRDPLPHARQFRPAHTPRQADESPGTLTVTDEYRRPNRK